MQQPPNDADRLFEALLHDLPPETEEMARDFKAFTRSRKIKSPLQLLRAVLLYAGLDKTLRDVAGTLTMLEEPITDSSVAERLAACAPWVKALLCQMLKSDVADLPPQWRFVVVDGSEVHGPGAMGSEYRLHVSIDLVTLEVTFLKITDQHTGESLDHFPLGPGDVGIADRGYGHPRAIVDTLQRGAELILRLNAQNVPLYQDDGSRLNWSEALHDQVPGTIRTFAVQIRHPVSGKTVQGWVHAYRLPEEQANRARQHCRRYHQKKGRHPKQQTMLLAGWVLVFTSIAPDLLSPATILALYRTRWQIELVIKRWKSLLDVDALRAKQGSPLADVWLHGKLLYALMLDKRTRKTIGDSWTRLDQERQATWWRAWKMMKDDIAPLITGVQFWKPNAWSHLINVLAERPRRRKLQQLPTEAVVVLQCLNTLQAPCMVKTAA